MIYRKFKFKTQVGTRGYDSTQTSAKPVDISSVSRNSAYKYSLQLRIKINILLPFLRLWVREY